MVLVLALELRLPLASSKGDFEMASDHYIEVMALLNAIVRCFNDNIGKIDMNRLGQPLLAGDLTAAATSTIEAKKV